jgi:predicted kinase
VSDLLLIAGPIASGKSTVAGALTARLRASGQRVALLDLDDVVASIGGFAALSSEWLEQAHEVLGLLVGTWLINGLDVVAHGPFFEPHARDSILRLVPAGTVVRQVLLMADYEVARRRVDGDPTRTVSKDPERLKRAYERASTLLSGLPPSDWTFDTAAIDATTIVDALSQALIPPTEPVPDR